MENTDAPMTDAEIEDEIQAKGLTAPRVTLEDIEAAIANEHYFTAADGDFGAIYRKSEGEVARAYLDTDPLTRLTFCVLELANGFTVTGESACVSHENFDAELGRKIARAKAIDKCWPLFGFALADRLNP